MKGIVKKSNIKVGDCIFAKRPLLPKDYGKLLLINYSKKYVYIKGYVTYIDGDKIALTNNGFGLSNLDNYRPDDRLIKDLSEYDFVEILKERPLEFTVEEWSTFLQFEEKHPGVIEYLKLAKKAKMI